MIREILLISLAFAVGARHHVNRASVDASAEPHNLGWLFSEGPQHLKSVSSESKPDRVVCHTKECQTMANKLLESMNKTADPCEDFYEYACGNWAKHNQPISTEMSSWNNLVKLGVKVQQELKNIVTAPVKPDDFLAMKLVKKWYAACMDTDAIEKRGLEPLLSTLARTGGWPMAMEPEMWDEEVFKWQKVDDYYGRLRGLNALHRLHSLQIGEKTHIVIIDAPTLPPRTRDIYDEVNVGDDDKDDVETCCEEDIDDDDDDDGNDEDDDSDSEDNSGDQSSGDDDDDDDSDDNDDDESGNKDSTENIIKGDSVSEDSDEHKTRLTKSKKSRRNHRTHHNQKETQIKTMKAKQTRHKHKVSAIKTKAGHKKVTKNGQVRKELHKLLKKRTKRSVLPTIVNHHLKHHGLNNGKGKLIEKRRSRKGRLNKLNSDETETTTEPSTDEDSDEQVSNLAAYYNYVSKVVAGIAELAGSNIDEDNLHEDIREMILFQLDLQRLVIPADPDNMTLESFQELYDDLEGDNPNSKVNWAEKAEDLLSEANVDFDRSEMIGAPIDYFKDLKTLLEETPSRTIVNYIHWSFVSRVLPFTTEKMRDLYNEWGLTEVSDDRHWECIGPSEMGQLLAYEYVKGRFTEDMKQFASDMIDDIQKEVEYEIKGSEWMDEDTRDSVLSKLVRMKKLIGYPDWYNNQTLVKRHLQGLTVGSSYFENKLSHYRFMKWADLRQVAGRGKDSSGGFPMNPATVNAVFLPSDNSITITAADFQSPLFVPGRPNTVNFAILGSVIAHEVNHGFDNDDHDIDKDGNRMQWLAQMAKAYSKRAECFIHQFNNYSQAIMSGKTKGYGNQTLDENIADTMGVQAVYKAHKRRERECAKPDDALPGMEEFSNDQLFFLSYGYTWCEWVKPGSEATEMQGDVHSPGRLRVIGPVSNLDEFAEAFNCPSGSAMNPKNKCNIWK